APLSRYVNPSASATARATVDFPAPAGPSMATTTYLHRLGGDRGRLQPHDLVGRGLVDRLLLQQALDERIELGPVRLEEGDDLLLGPVDDAPDLGVDQLLGALRGLGYAGQERPLAVAARDRDRPDLVAHAPAADHLAGDVGELLDVGLGAGRDLVVDDPLGGPAPQRHLDAADEVAAVV